MTQRSILITGASSGLGAALALHYAAPGVFLALGGRNRDRLAAIAKACREKGAEAAETTVDVANRAAMAAWIGQTDAAHPLDLVIANAGISGGAGGGKDMPGESPEQARRIFEVNLTGALNTIEPVLPLMLARRKGQIALMSSLAGFCGWPGAPAYSASKGAVRLYGEALRGACASHGVKINVLCPGFVRTPMTDVNPFPMPFLMDAPRAAKIMADGLAGNKARIAFPWPTYLLSGFFGLLPAAISSRLLRRFPGKPGRAE
jgi:short-subunit dehydrogenase